MIGATWRDAGQQSPKLRHREVGLHLLDFALDAGLGRVFHEHPPLLGLLRADGRADRAAGLGVKAMVSRQSRLAHGQGEWRSALDILFVG